MEQGLQTLMLQYMSPKASSGLSMDRKNVHARTYQAAFRMAIAQKYADADAKKIASTYAQKMVKYQEQHGIDIS
eukprot:3214382-Karenia_brevis.AAC.1